MWNSKHRNLEAAPMHRGAGFYGVYEPARKRSRYGIHPAFLIALGVGFFCALLYGAPIAVGLFGAIAGAVGG